MAGTNMSPEIGMALVNCRNQIFQMQQDIVVSLASASAIPPPPINPLQQPPPTMIPPPGTAGPPPGVPMPTPSMDEVASSKLNQWKQASAMSDHQQQRQMSGLGGAESQSSGDSVTGSHLDIEEFVPGKPWQGPSVRSVEDDPYITPGSVARSSISSIDDAHVMNVLGGKSTVGPIGKPTPGAMSKTGSMVWPNDGSGAPGLGIGHPTSASHLNRSVSWAAGERTTPGCELSNIFNYQFCYNFLVLLINVLIIPMAHPSS